MACPLWNLNQESEAEPVFAGSVARVTGKGRWSISYRVLAAERLGEFPARQGAMLFKELVTLDDALSGRAMSSAPDAADADRG